ncbi:MAG: methionine ABC transporter permease MetI [Legionellales bacterium]|nr:methionine ABC transporter permease MetI [Legionellales bacterium]
MSINLLTELGFATWQTLYMVGVASGIAVIIGLPLGIILFTTRSGGILAKPAFNKLLGSMVNALRSIPFIILLVAIIPFTRWVVGTSIGATAAIIPLAVGAIPFLARIIENALEEVSKGLIEAGQAMGASALQIIRYILLPEALSGIINGITVTVITLVSYSAMAGVVGGGGLGDLAIRYGYQRFDAMVMLTTIVILIVIVQLMQMFGDYLAKRVNH